MTIDAKAKDGKLQFDINRDAEKISTLSSGEIDKYEYIKEVMLSDQSRIKGKARFTYSPLEKASEKKQNKTKQNK